MVKFTLQQLRYFCRVADAGSFTAAAAEEFVSATAVSAAIRTLEMNLGTQLFHRQRSIGATLTSSGRLLYVEAKKLLASASEVGYLMKGGGNLVGPLSVGCFSTVAPTLLPEILQKFEDAHPAVDVVVRIQSQDSLLSELAQGNLDVVFIYDIELPENLHKYHLYHAPIHIIVSEAHPLAKTPSVSLADLAEEPLILFSTTPAGPHTLRVLNRVGFEPKIRYRISDYELVRSMVARNLGYSLMIHSNPVARSYEGFALAEVPIEDPMPLESLVAVWPRGLRLNPRAQEFLSLSAASMKERDHQSAGKK